jgi:uncharacterized protein (DUF488 family)
MATVWTVGHGARSLDDFVDVLRSASLELLVDVRMFPGSRRHPHFSRDALERSLGGYGIAYDWRGEALGGRRKPAAASRHPAWRNDSFRAYADHMDTPEFRQALVRLEDEAGGGTRLAVMCAETLWWRCHRRLISDALTVDGIEVIHLLAPDQHQPHKLHEALRRDENGRPVYDVGVDAELPLVPPDPERS